MSNIKSPFYLIRICGDSIDLLDKLKNEEIFERIKIWNKQSDDNNNKGIELNDKLHEYNQRLGDRSIQNKIQNVRRKIFNRKKISDKDFQSISTIDFDLLKDLEIYVKNKNDIEISLKEIEKEYNDEVARSRNELIKLISDNHFLKGLLLSSTNLFSKTKRYLEESDTLGEKEKEKTENTILKYYSRYLTKTSPFSTFTGVDLREVGGNTKNEDKFLAKSHVRLNGFLHRSILNLIKSDNYLNGFLLIEPNETLTLSKDSIHFLTNQNNIEIFQKIDNNQVLEYIIETISSEPIRLNDLIIILKSEIDEAASDLKNYLLELVSIGLLELKIDSSPMDPNWVDNLLDFLVLDPGLAKGAEKITSTLKTINDLCDNYQLVDFEKRERILFEIRDHLRDLFNDYKDSEDSSVELPPPQNLIYEDTSVNSGIEISADKIDQIVNCVSNNLDKIILFGGENIERKRIIDFFSKKYNKRAEVNLLKFYKEYYEEFKVPVKNKELEDKSDAHRQELIIEWKRKIAQRISSKVNNDGVDISTSDLEFDVDDYNLNNTKTSHGAFFQFGTSGIPVVNGIFPGYGKMFSRFLHLFDESFSQQLVQLNYKDVNENNLILAENSDSTFFNANIHPPLLKKEIRIPGGFNRTKKRDQISVSELEVRFCEEEKKCVLYHSNSGKKIEVIDLGFESHERRSELFQLLDKFNNTRYLGFRPVCELVNRIIELKFELKNEPFKIYPRVVLSNEIVIQRKNWILDVDELKKKINVTDGIDFSTGISKLKEELDIPNEVYVTIDPHLKFDKKNSNKRNRNAVKPQFIDFESIFFLRLLSKTIIQAEKSLKIEEMYPEKEDLFKINGKRYVTEFVFEWRK